MDLLQRAKVFRLKCSHHSKYLVADEDEEQVRQSRDKSSSKARWVYELVEGKKNVIRIRSGWSYRYLTASDDPFLLGMTGKKVLQTISHGPIIEWEPIKEGPYIKLKSHKGSYLRANPRVPPWRNSVTHDEPGNWAVTDNMILWIVDIVEIDYQFSGVADDGSTELMEDNRESNVSSVSSDIGDHKSMYSGLEDELNDTKGTGATSAKSNSEHIHQVEVEMAKKTLKELKDLDFHTILTSQRGEKLEKVVKVLIADAKSQGRIPGDLINLQGQLKVMQNEHVSASQNLIKYNSFSTRKSEIMAELKRDAAQARELETLQGELQTARNAKEELVKQLEEVENIITDLEKAQADNLADAEELISRMGQKSQKLEEMKNEEGAWQVRRTEANRMLERVEEDWVKIKTMFLAD
ncbi:uncharacterized protein LOC110727078 [Chenopodium quinoa]|uniref:DUF569 domain-containing protein n=1 Tax=Chenopodium quinoa TaxID=63459 RepID=A0A803ML46_CHEQI|nr:uncharacterized protein LOC110727078 [Chenopodium quinoa]